MSDLHPDPIDLHTDDVFTVRVPAPKSASKHVAREVVMTYEAGTSIVKRLVIFGFVVAVVAALILVGYFIGLTR